jgi:hypothetical protein
MDGTTAKRGYMRFLEVMVTQVPSFGVKKKQVIIELSLGPLSKREMLWYWPLKWPLLEKYLS